MDMSPPIAGVAPKDDGGDPPAETLPDWWGRLPVWLQTGVRETLLAGGLELPEA